MVRYVSLAPLALSSYDFVLDKCSRCTPIVRSSSISEPNSRLTFESPFAPVATRNSFSRRPVPTRRYGVRCRKRQGRSVARLLFLSSFLRRSRQYQNAGASIHIFVQNFVSTSVGDLQSVAQQCFPFISPRPHLLPVFFLLHKSYTTSACSSGPWSSVRSFLLSYLTSTFP